MTQPDRVLVLDKEAGITSHDVVARVRRVLGRGSAAGHAGTLDPFATGVLVVATGRATRIVRFLTATAKTYLADITLGVTTDSDDVTGVVLAEHPVSASAADVVEALGQFRGTFSQVPPRISAVWVNGERLYRRTRRGEDVEAPARLVHVGQLDVLACTPPSIRIRVACSAGTYIRAIARDLGELLGCGGHLAGLRREVAGPFTLDRALPTSRLCDPDAAEAMEGCAMEVEEALAFLPSAELTWEQTARLVHGQAPQCADLVIEGGDLLHRVAALRAPNGRIVAMIDRPDPAGIEAPEARVSILRVLSTPAEIAAGRPQAEAALA